MSNHVLSKPELRQSKPGRGCFAAQARNPISVVLDGVTGNYNIGAMFRLCDAFLVERLVICGDTSRSLLLPRKVVQAAAGTQCWVPWVEAPDAVTVVPGGKAAGQWIAVVELTIAERHAGTDAAALSGCAGARQRALRRFARGMLAYADQTVTRFQCWAWRTR